MTSILVSMIVPNGTGEKFAAAARAAGAPGGTILPARGTARSAFLAMLGFGDSAKEVVLCAVASEKYGAVLDSIRAAASDRKSGFGILFTIPLSSFCSLSPTETSDFQSQPNTNAMQESQFRLLHIIVNKGFADDAMAAARKAGAGGGTVIGARGTAKPDDATFLGVPLVPEKETLLVIVPAARAEAVLSAIRALPCFSAKGSGIAFSVPVSDFIPLGG